MITAGDTLLADEAGAQATIGAFATDHSGNLLALTTRAFAASGQSFYTPDDPVRSAGQRPSGYYADIPDRPDAAENLIGWLIVPRHATVASALTGRATGIDDELLLEDVSMRGADGARCEGYVSGLDSSARFTLGDSEAPRVYRGLIRVSPPTPRPRFAAPGSAGALLHNARGDLLGIYVGEAGGQGLFAPLANALAAEGLELASNEAIAAHNRRARESSPHNWGFERPPAIERIVRTRPPAEVADLTPAAILFEWVSAGIARQQAGDETAFSPYSNYFDNDPHDRNGLLTRLSEFCYNELPQGPDAAEWERVVTDAYAASVRRSAADETASDPRGSHARVLPKAA